MFPLLLYLPAALGLAPIGVKDITGLTMAQGFFAALSALLFYRRERLVSRGLVLSLGLSLFLSSLAGSIASKRVPDGPILLAFGTMALFASAMMFIPRSRLRDELTGEEVSFSRPLAVATGLPVGFVLGMVGQGGAFIIIPILLYVLRVPLRVAFGSTLAIGLFSSTAGLAGKVATGQVRFGMVFFLLAGAVPMAYAGATAGRRTNTKYLRWILAALISASALKIWADILGSSGR